MPNLPQTRSDPSSRPLPRYPSYSKRHASFNSPREVPLPSPTISLHEDHNPFSFSTTAPHQAASSSRAQDAFENNSSSQSLPRPQSPSSTVFEGKNLRSSGSSSRPRSPASPTQQSSPPYDAARKHRHPHNRQMSVGSSSPTDSAPSELPQQGRSVEGRVTNDNSPADIIYPLTRPFSLTETQSSSYSTLNSYLRQPPPSPPAMASRVSTTWLDRFSSSSLPLPSQIPFYTLPRVNTASNFVRPPALVGTATDSNLDVRAPSSSSIPPSLSTEVASSGPGTEPPLFRTGFRSPSIDDKSSSSSSGSGSRSSSSSADSIATTNTSFNTENSIPFPDKSSFAAPLPSVSSDSRNENPPIARPVSPFRAPQPPLPQAARAQASDFNTAMRRYMTPAPSYPLPEPPVILPAEPRDDMTQPPSRLSAPHFPFLSHAPPPPDSWIEVETTLSEYNLHVRLPGFSRDGITLATKRRRILHVVADSWENGGGHFERRISFGYDADLVQVRAEFDGTMLRISVPRRISPVMLHTPCSEPIGRV